MAGIVVDSSIALSWCLPDEDTIDPAPLRLCTGVLRLPTHY
jgi:hypothetical protein